MPYRERASRIRPAGVDYGHFGRGVNGKTPAPRSGSDGRQAKGLAALSCLITNDAPPMANGR